MIWSQHFIYTMFSTNTVRCVPEVFNLNMIPLTMIPNYCFIWLTYYIIYLYWDFHFRSNRKFKVIDDDQRISESEMEKLLLLDFRFWKWLLCRKSMSVYKYVPWGLYFICNGQTLVHQWRLYRFKSQSGWSVKVTSEKKFIAVGGFIKKDRWTMVHEALHMMGHDLAMGD